MSGELQQQISEAIGAHGKWKMRLKNGVTNGAIEVSSADATRDDVCQFGKWLNSVASDASVSGSRHFQTVREKHAAFHKAAGEIVAMIERGDKAGADNKLSSPQFDDLTKSLNMAMMAWKRAN